ncbi:MAG: DUF5654 family protein [Candidatus Kaiserbacteria bacterium]|nr:DUF5654 family protein [Candidatus Kaiserbacteria bacterium]
MGGLKDELRSKILTFVGGAFGLVAGLAWNDAVKELILYLYPAATDTVMAKFVYAIFITIIVVIIITYLERVFKSEEASKEIKSRKNEDEEPSN